MRPPPSPDLHAQAIYDEHGGLHKAFTQPSFFGGPPRQEAPATAGGLCGHERAA